MIDVSANFRQISRCIHEAALNRGQNPTEIKLLAAAQSESIDVLRAALGARITLVGENYVQETADK